MNGLRVLAVDDEPPALAEVAFLLRADARVAEVLEAGTPAVALQVLEAGGVDAVFLDIAMPGLDGLTLARLLPRFDPVPVLVFVTAHEESALAAFEMRAVDYVLKPVREERLAEAVRRVVQASHPAAEQVEVLTDEVLTVEVGTSTRFVHRSEVIYAEAQGDYARLHTAAGSYLCSAAARGCACSSAAPDGSTGSRADRAGAAAARRGGDPAGAGCSSGCSPASSACRARARQRRCTRRGQRRSTAPASVLVG